MAVRINVGSRKRRKPSNVHFNVQRSEMFKVVFLGDSNVGKTCLAKMLVDKRAVEQSTATIGFDYHTTEIKLKDGVRTALQIWDTAGMEKFRDAPALIPQYYHNTDGIVLVFDLSEKDSFDGLGNWISEMKRHSTRRSRTDKINMILVGNKLDLKQERVVSKKAAQAFADSHNMVAYIELSAKDIHYLESLEDAFATLASHMIKSREQEREQIVRTASQTNMSIRSTTPRHHIEREWTSTGSADPLRVRPPIEKEFTSSGSLFANDWEILSASDDQVPEYVYSDQERKRLEAQKCAC